MPRWNLLQHKTKVGLTFLEEQNPEHLIVLPNGSSPKMNTNHNKRKIAFLRVADLPNFSA